MDPRVIALFKRGLGTRTRPSNNKKPAMKFLETAFNTVKRGASALSLLDVREAVQLKPAQLERAGRLGETLRGVRLRGGQGEAGAARALLHAPSQRARGGAADGARL